jgi:hypothetical protein
MMMSVLLCEHILTNAQNAANDEPTLSLTFLSASVLAVALLKSIILHFRPCPNFRHSLCI